MKPATLIRIAAALVLTTACSFKSGNSLSPSAPSTPSNNTSTPSFVGTWASESVTSQVPSSCNRFQWTISGQTSTSLTGSFTAECSGGVTAFATASGQLVNSSTVAIAVTGTAALPINPNCQFTLNGAGTIIDNGTGLTIPYTGNTCLGPVHGTEVLRKAAPAPPPPPPPPTPPVPPTPPPPPPSGPSDGLDLHQVTVYNSPADIANWSVTAAVTQLIMDPSAGVTIHFTKENDWPDYTPPGWTGPLEYTVWAVVNVNGQWYTSGFIQMWRNRENTGAPIIREFATNWAYDSRWGPMQGHQPYAGEPMGFFVSAGNARGDKGVTSLRERSNVVVVSLPAGDSGVFNYSLARLPLFSHR